MKNLLIQFMYDVVNGEFDPNPINNSKCPDIQTNQGLIYNEFSLQHALGAYLKNKLGNGYRVEFERNSERCFGIKTSTKHEIDIVVYNGNHRKCAIELKFPRNRQYPEQMFSFIKDISFLEELKNASQCPFKEAYAITLVDDENFYIDTGKSTPNYIYDHFRVKNNNSSLVLKKGQYKQPTGKKNTVVTLKNDYQINWVIANDTNLAYYIVQIK